MGTKFTDNTAKTTLANTDMFAFSADNTPSPGFTSKKITWANIKAALLALMGGDVYGPASVADGAAALFDGGTGKLIKEGAVPPLIYKAFLNQTGTNNPVATEIMNTIGAIVWTRASTGLYYGALAGAFPINKVFFTPNDPPSSDDNPTINLSHDANSIRITTTINSSNTDSLLLDSPISIEVYQ